MNKPISILSLLLILFCGTISFGQGTSGMPGVIFTRIGSSHTGANTSAIQKNGKIIVGGTSILNSREVFTVVRYNSNGSLDTSFNGTGIITTEVGSGDAGINSIVIQTDGKIIAAGTCFNGSNDDFAVVRYNSNGSLDTTFNETGIVVTQVGNGRYDYARAVELQADGKIVVTGSDENPDPNGSNSFAAVVRYNPNGTLDTSFNGTQATAKKPFDFDGDGRADISLFRPTDRVWYVQNSSNSSVNYTQFGLSTDKIVPADYDGDGKTDIAVYRPENGIWYQLKSRDGFSIVRFGLDTDRPAPNAFVY